MVGQLEFHLQTLLLKLVDFRVWLAKSRQLGFMCSHVLTTFESHKLRISETNHDLKLIPICTNFSTFTNSAHIQNRKFQRQHSHTWTIFGDVDLKNARSRSRMGKMDEIDAIPSCQRLMLIDFVYFSHSGWHAPEMQKSSHSSRRACQRLAFERIPNTSASWPK